MIAIMLERCFPRVSTRTHVHGGETIFRRGSKVANLHWVRSGSVRLTRTLLSGAEVTLARAIDGESFAEAALFAEQHHCDAIADIDSEVVAVPKSKVLAAIEHDAAFAQGLLAALAKQVRDLRGTIEIRNIRRASDRLLAWLELNATGSPAKLHLSRPWAAVSAELGLTPEATYRGLADLERSGSIQRPNRQSVVLKTLTGADAGSTTKSRRQQSQPRARLAQS